MMLIFTNNSGDELFSDTYPMKVVDDIFYEVEGKVSKESWYCTCILIVWV